MKACLSSKQKVGCLIKQLLNRKKAWRFYVHVVWFMVIAITMVIAIQQLGFRVVQRVL